MYSIASFVLMGQTIWCHLIFPCLLGCFAIASLVEDALVKGVEEDGGNYYLPGGIYLAQSGAAEPSLLCMLAPSSSGLGSYLRKVRLKGNSQGFLLVGSTKEEGRMELMNQTSLYQFLQCMNMLLQMQISLKDNSKRQFKSMLPFLFWVNPGSLFWFLTLVRSAFLYCSHVHVGL